MKRIFLFITILATYLIVNATYYSYKCFTDVYAFSYDRLSIWLAPDLKIKGGDYINAGLKVEAEFYIPTQTPINPSIISLGVSVGNLYIPAFTLRQNGTSLQLVRPVKLGVITQDYVHECWTPDLLKPLRNYHIVFEVDETRCRIKLWEIGNEATTDCEYIFYGLMTSEAKEVLGTTTTMGRKLSIGTNSKYHVQTASVADLGYGVGVDVPEPPTQTSWATLTNQNSNMNFSLYENGTYEGISIVQRSKNTPGCFSMWEIDPIYMPTRIPSSYSVRFKNMLTSYGATIKDCLSREYDPLINATSEDCDTWLLYRPSDRQNRYNLSNRRHGLFAEVKDNSKEDGATIWSRYTAEGPSAEWNIKQVTFPDPQLENGTYSFKYDYSSLYMLPKYQEYGYHQLVQNHEQLYNTAWYLQKEPSGLMTIQNVDTKEYAVTYNAELRNRAAIVQWETAESGNSKWIVEKRGIYHTFKNLNSNGYIEVDMNYPASPGSEIQQNSYSGATPLWLLTPINYGPKESLGGMYSIQNVATGKYLGIERNSTTPGAEAVSRPNWGDISSWWSFIFEKTGGVAIRNVNSQLFLDIQDASLYTAAIGVQSSRDSDKRGHSLWILESTGSPNLFRIKNIHSGKYLMFTSELHNEDDVAVIQVDRSDKTDPNLIWSFELIQIF